MPGAGVSHLPRSVRARSPHALKKIKDKKKARHIEEKKKAKRIKRYSKFAEKYSDRIESIQQSETIRQENLKKQEMENKKQK